MCGKVTIQSLIWVLVYTMKEDCFYKIILWEGKLVRQPMGDSRSEISCKQPKPVVPAAPMPPMSGSSSIEEVSSTSTLVVGSNSTDPLAKNQPPKTFPSFNAEVGGGRFHNQNTANHAHHQQQQQQTSLSNFFGQTGALSKRFTVRGYWNSNLITIQ